MGNEDYIPVKEFYTGKSIFLTGGTGFLGKVLVEKLLWSCPNIENVYLLIRPTKFLNATQRLEKVLNTPVFERLRQRGEFSLKKIIPIEGDIKSTALGIGTRDQKMLSKKVAIVIHLAANTRFDTDLKTAVDVNMIGTKNVIQFCYLLSKLQALVHISTAYSNCDQKEITENIYPSLHDPEKFIEYVQSMNDEHALASTPKIVGKHPNVYTFTEALVENILLYERPRLPIVIVRPSLVLAAIRDPVPGWIDTWNDPTSLIATTCKGIFRTIFCYRDMNADFIPVDMVANLIICAGWNVATQKSKGNFHVYNCCTHQQNPVSWKQFVDYFLVSWKKHPLRNVLLYPHIFLLSQTILYETLTFSFETLPAYVLDFCYRLLGKEQKFVRNHKKLMKIKHELLFWTTHEWRYKMDTVKDLNNLLREEDKQTFPFDAREIDWSSYIDKYCQGMCRYLLKDVQI